MGIKRWTPPVDLSRREQLLMKRLGRVRKLLGFLRRHRHEIVNESFQDELSAMYRKTGAGKEPVTPGLLAMATLVQGYLGVSDAEMVELTVVDLRVQMVLGLLGAEAPGFSQGAFHDFRDRLIEFDMDRRLLERTVELAKNTGEFDYRKLPKTLRVAVDSSPLEGAGRVEDTFNLLAHAARKIIACAATILEQRFDEVCDAAGIPLLKQSSVKRGLDVDWNDSSAKANAINVLCEQLDDLQRWLEDTLPAESGRKPLQDLVETLRQLRGQDLEPDPEGGGVRVREGVATERRVSVEDGEMRHGRKSKKKRFEGFKRHLAVDVDLGLILACAVTPANRPEAEAMPDIGADVREQGIVVHELQVDRAYVNSSLVDEVLGRKGNVIAKPWRFRNGALFAKSDFKINMSDWTIECPAGFVKRFRLGSVVEFDPMLCDHCPVRGKCTTAEYGHGRTVSIAENEPLQNKLRKLTSTAAGRSKLRERTVVEHKLAHLGQRQGRRARYRGTRKNTFDVRRAAAIQNLEVAHREARSRETRNAA